MFTHDRSSRELIHRGFLVLQPHMLHIYPKQIFVMADLLQSTLQLVEVVSAKYHSNILESVTLKTENGTTLTLNHQQIEHDFYFKEVVA